MADTVDSSNLAHRSIADAPASGALSRPTLSGYTILGEIGRGGMGVVYRARQLSLNRLVALKMILAGSHASAKEIGRFQTEAEAVARLKHPNIVQIYEIGQHEGLPFLALELVDGPSLDAVVRGRPFAAAHAARLVETLARAMHHVHQQGIVHRDLKPANVLLQKDESRGMKDEPGWADSSLILHPSSFQPKITDFGLAKLLDDEAANSPTRTLVGTPNYMAPEQAVGQGKPTGPLADVYSLGAILYELLTGRPPFQGKTVFSVLDQVRTRDVVPPGRVAANVPRDLETICLKCLKKDPAQRYASALDLAEDLRRLQANEPILARPAGLWERAVKWTQRRPAVAAVAAVTIAAAIVLTMANQRHGLDLQATEDQARAGERRVQLDRLEKARLAYRTFTKHRGDALFHWSLATVLTGSDTASHLAATTEAARLALAVVDLNDNSDSMPRLNPYWSSREKEEITAGCYQLFLVLADTTAQPTPRQSVLNHQQSLRQAISMLDRAAKSFQPTQAYHLRCARYLVQLGDEDDARREVKLGMGAAPSTFMDYLLLGDERYQRGEIEAAAQNFKRALVIAPNDFWSQCLLAVCNLRMQRPAEAEAGLSVCIAERPDFTYAWLLRGLAHAELKNFAAADSDYRAALQMHPDADAQYAIHVSRGLLSFQQKKYEEAVAQLRKAIELKPEQINSRVTLAKVYQAQGSLDKALDQLDQVLGLDVPAAVAVECHVERSRSLYLCKEYHAALQAAEMAVTIGPDCAVAYQQCGFVLVELKRFKDAAASFDRFLAKGGKPGTDFYRARGRASMQLGAYLDASEDYTRALEAGPDSDLLVHRGFAFYFADAWQPANRDFDQALRLNPEDGDAYTGRGLAQVMLGRYREAVADADEALRRQPCAGNDAQCRLHLRTGRGRRREEPGGQISGGTVPGKRSGCGTPDSGHGAVAGTFTVLAGENRSRPGAGIDSPFAGFQGPGPMNQRIAQGDLDSLDFSTSAKNMN